MTNKQELIENLFAQTYFDEDSGYTEEELKELKLMSLDEKAESLIQYYQAAGFPVETIEDIIEKN